MHPNSLLRLWHYINHLLTYLLTYITLLDYISLDCITLSGVLDFLIIIFYIFKFFGYS